MSLETNLNTTPYWDDYNEAKDFYKILFKPGVSIQTRELNQLQTILQKQVERFGDHVFKSGTIVSGVNFSYNSLLPYAKIRDLQENGQPVNPAAYVGFLLSVYLLQVDHSPTVKLLLKLQPEQEFKLLALHQVLMLIIRFFL